MSQSTRWLRCCSGLCLGLICLAASSCQRYQAKPLDLQERAARWASYDRDYLQQHFATTASEQTFNLADGINLAEAESIALFYNPTLQRARLQTLSYKSGAEYAGLWQDPELAVDGAYILEEVDEQLLGGASLSWSLPLSGRSSAAKTLAIAEFDAAKQQVILAEWRLLQELRQQWVLLYTHEQQIALRSSFIIDLEQSIRIAEDLAGAQFLKPQALQALKLEHAQYKQLLLQDRGAYTQQQLLIIHLLGLHPGQSWQLNSHNVEQPALTSIDQPIAHPLIQQHSQQYIIAERALAYEIRKQYPDLSLSLGMGSEDGESRLLFGFGLNPLALWNRNKHGIASARAQRALAGLDAEIALRDLMHRQRQLQLQIQQQDAELQHITQIIQPLADQHIKSIRDSFATGDIDILELIHALKNSFDSRMQTLTTASALRINELALAGLSVPLKQEAASHE